MNQFFYLELVVGALSVRDLLADPLVDGLVLAITGVLLGLQPLVQGGNVGLATVVLGLGKVVQSGDLGLARVVLAVGKVVQVGDLGLASVVLGVELAVELGDVGDTGLVLLGAFLLQGLDLVLSGKQNKKINMDCLYYMREIVN